MQRKGMQDRINAELMECGRRISDIINDKREHYSWEELRRSWMAFRLKDGGSDGVLYATRRECVRHQVDEMRCMYLACQSFAGGAKPKDMAILTLYWREAYAAGFRGTDPQHEHGGREPIPTARAVDAVKSKLAIPGLPDLDNALGDDGKRLTEEDKAAFMRAWVNELRGLSS